MSATRLISTLALVFGALFGLEGCGAGHGGASDGSYGYGPAGPAQTTTYYGAGGAYVPPTAGPTLTVQVTNNSSASFDVTATTPDQVVDGGEVLPGDTIYFDLGELPSYVTLSAAATSADPTGFVPTYPDVTLSFGADYSDANPFSGVEWSDGGMSAYDSITTNGSTSAPPRGSAPFEVVTKVPAKSHVRVVVPTHKPRA